MLIWHSIGPPPLTVTQKWLFSYLSSHICYIRRYPSPLFKLNFSLSSFIVLTLCFFVSKTYINEIIFAQRCNFAQRERVKLESCPKNCSFPSPLEPFWITMTAITLSFEWLYSTPLYENKQNVREIIQRRLLRKIQQFWWDSILSFDIFAIFQTN